MLFEEKSPIGLLVRKVSINREGKKYSKTQSEAGCQCERSSENIHTGELLLAYRGGEKFQTVNYQQIFFHVKTLFEKDLEV